MQNYHFVLGADDPEMRRIEDVLLEQNIPYTLARSSSDPRERVSPSNAYEADADVADSSKQYVFVECALQAGPSLGSIHIDHHREGDVGYDLGPSRFWEACSLGQTMRLLDVKPSKKDLILGAMDHCFDEALKGNCGEHIKPKDVYDMSNWYMAERFNMQSLSVEIVVGFFENMFKRANRHGKTSWGEDVVLVDVRDSTWTRRSFIQIKKPLGQGYSFVYLAAKVAATRVGAAVELRLQDEADGPMKHHLCGNVSEELVRWYMDEWAPMQDFTHIYGVPKRGYAGGRAA